ncbi:MAG: riboflavin synthase [Pseudomonadales bacterium]|nr:riboflavin synthase [Pseudomonadales bacterium]
MFTGIIAAVGKVAGFQPGTADWQLRVDSGSLDLGDVQLGDSISVNGVCLTVVRLEHQGFAADVSNETRQLTTLQQLKPGAMVNLEKALSLSDRLGGHIVSGHVDGIGELIQQVADGGSMRMTFRAPAALARYIAQKGSICIDGASLTVNAVNGAEFSVNIIPHTQTKTVMQAYQVGHRVNLEVDLISRYLERLLLGEQAAAPDTDKSLQKTAGITRELLLQHGFARGEV